MEKQRSIICPNCGTKVPVAITNRLGRKPLNISVKNIRDTLRDCREIALAAEKLGCSRAYIYHELKAQIKELEAQIKASQDAVISIPKLEQFIERMQGRISSLDFEGKRQVLDMLGITVYLDGESVEVTGVIDTEGVIVTTPPYK